MTTVYDYRTVCDGPGCGKVQPRSPAMDAIQGWVSVTVYLDPPPVSEREGFEDTMERDFCGFECLRNWVNHMCSHG